MRFLASLLLPLPMFCQLSGTVVDTDGLAIERANVQARNPQGGTAATTISARDGKYAFTSLAPGTYDIIVNGVPAMGAFEKKGVTISANPETLEIRLGFNTQLGTLGEDRVNGANDQRRHKPPAGPTPLTKDGKPDFSGVWWRPTDVDGGNPQFKPEADSVARARREQNSKDSPAVRCLPGNALRFGPMFQFVQSDDYVVIINDDESPGFHQVYLNKKHPEDPNPGWYGHNVGRWEGDTLVVDRVAFDERLWLDQAGHPHSPQLHVVERYRRPNLGKLEIEVTVDDPGVLTKPYTAKRVADLAQGYDIYEFICSENERDAVHMVGK